MDRLENYQWIWDEQGETYRKQPKHNFASNGADAFQTFGWGYRSEGSFARQQEEVVAAAEGLGYTRKFRANRKLDAAHIL